MNLRFSKVLLMMSVTFSSLVMMASEAQRYKNLELLSKIIYVIEKQYYRKVDHKQLVEGAIEGMVSQLDPHSSFLNKELMKQVKDDTQGQFGGLGIEVYRKKSEAFIVNVLEDSPAYKVGIKPGDQIVEINKKNMLNKPFEELVESLQGKIGQKITLGVKREDSKEVLRFTMKRKVIKIKAVQGTLIDNQVAYIRLIQFQEKAGLEVQAKLKKLKQSVKARIKGIILDLRGNPGGLLDEAVNVSSTFLEKGIVVSTEARDPQRKDIRYVRKSVYKDLETPIIVLINGHSASASEIVAGALQDHKRALVAGSQSFGKGSVQSVAQIGEEQGLKLTIAQYMTPKKRKIQAIGIKPDIEMESFDLEKVRENFPQREYIRESDLNNHLKSSQKISKIKKRNFSKLELRLQKDSQVQQAVGILKAQAFLDR